MACTLCYKLSNNKNIFRVQLHSFEEKKNTVISSECRLMNMACKQPAMHLYHQLQGDTIITVYIIRVIYHYIMAHPKIYTPAESQS